MNFFATFKVENIFDYIIKKLVKIPEKEIYCCKCSKQMKSKIIKKKYDEYIRITEKITELGIDMCRACPICETMYGEEATLYCPDCTDWYWPTMPCCCFDGFKHHK